MLLKNNMTFLENLKKTRQTKGPQTTKRKARRHSGHSEQVEGIVSHVKSLHSDKYDNIPNLS